MSSYLRVLQVIREMIDKVNTQNTSKFQKPHFLRILLSDRVIFKKTLNETLRYNDVVIREQWMKYMHTTNRPNYYTIVGEVLVKYINDDLEKDLLNLTNDERQNLIQEINKRTGNI